MSATVPGPNARNHRSTSPATPSASVRGSISSPSQDTVEVQRGRETVQPPSFDARTMRPAADSVVSTRGPTGRFPAHDLPSP